MRCPNCNALMLNGCCVRCGTLENGNQSNNEYVSKYDDDRKYNDDFDMMYRNENWYTPFIIGNLYFSYRKHLLLGIIFGIIDFALFYFLSYSYSKMNFANLYLYYYIMFFFELLVRTLYSIISNSICLSLDKRKIKKLKKKNKFLPTGDRKSILLAFLNIFIYIFIIAILVIIRRIQNGTI